MLKYLNQKIEHNEMLIYRKSSLLWRLLTFNNERI